MKNLELNINSSKVQAQLALCATAVAGFAVVAPNADAALVTTFDNTIIAVPATTSGVYLNLLTGASGATGAVTGYDFNPYLTQSGVLGFYWNPSTVGGLRGAGVTGTATGTTYVDLAAGSTVSASSFFTSAILGTSASFLSTGIHNLGFRFVNEATGAIDYGYLKIQTATTTGFPATILGWRFDNAGAAVTVVPEPSTVALLALVGGGAGVRAWRRRRAA